jgi:hypothetical protein
VEQDLVSGPGPEPLAQRPEPIELEEHERQWLAMMPAVINRVLQLGHQRGMVQESGEAVPKDHLPHPAAPSRPRDDHLHQKLRLGIGREKIVGPCSERRDPVGAAFLPDKDNGEQIVSGILPDQSGHRECIGANQPGVE